MPLSAEDIAEVEKWISRAKSTDGLKDIKEALEEMNKYYPGEVSNIYAVIQKIIIGGANKSKRKPAQKG
jgi:hypothetical protein